MTAATFRELCLTRNEPLILTDAVRQWPAMNRWTWELLTRDYGSLRVKVTRKEGEAMVTLRDFVDFVQAPDEYELEGSPPYLTDWHVQDDCPELLWDIVVPPYMDDWFEAFPPADRPRATWFYIGPDGSGSVLHQDAGATHAWLACIKGVKRWRLLPPGTFAQDLVAPSGVVDANLFDRACWSDLARNTVRYDARLEPGELIFVPARWFHQVRNEGPSWAITRNYFDASNFPLVWQQRLDRGDRAFLLRMARALWARRNTVVDGDAYTERWIRQNEELVASLFPHGTG